MESRSKTIPTLEEIQSLYETDLRNEALQNIENYDEEENIFLKRFRKTEKVEVNKTTEENFYYKKYKDYIKREKLKKEEELEEIRNSIDYEKFLLRWERRVNREKTNRHSSNSATRYRVDRIKELERELETLLKESPEAWEVYYKQELLRDIETQHQQKLVTSPYVLEAKEKVVSSLELGKPVYIVGHLGSGKTQLATEAALEFTVENRIQSELEKEMNDWIKDNMECSEEEAFKKFIELNKEKRKYYSDILLKGSKEELEELQPLFISGSYNLTYEDMFVEKTLSLEQSFSEKSFSDYLNMIIVDFYSWLEEHKDTLSEMTEEEQLQLKIQIWKSFSDLLVASNSAFGTEIKKIEREILIAVKEGRTVIVDELNTIAMQNLIGLNDILQKRVGSTAYITGVGPVYIKQGFGFIGTGNLSTENVNYEGTNELNPAFKSRLTTIEYNYPPQEIVGSLFEQENPKENELFRIIIARLADDNGNIYLPNPKKTLEELFRFAQLSKVTQNVFMGKWDDGIEQTFSSDEVELKESVLSIRNILNVLDNWNFGEEKDLSKALWDGFISSITNPDDQNYILSQAVRFGFFSESEGWNVRTKKIGSALSSYSEIRKWEYSYSRAEVMPLSYLDLLYLAFGRENQRREIPQELKIYFKEEIMPNIDVEQYQILDKKLSHLEHSKHLLELTEDELDG
ncbi:hypothetical protein [Anaerosphaera multitolerans]|uniref:ATPase dynein-related AAA domain-containing protein n=1 Tax=Anaerosphaera multitolerans TaxID=2487351 RepID=A0A437S4U6_9FIRM|nr:hypothetical protein [Anaerosphaera multitolerans]RVU54020.1 hypothetical protein EF514_09610 [Anaerosphaera multitolerans]